MPTEMRLPWTRRPLTRRTRRTIAVALAVVVVSLTVRLGLAFLPSLGVCIAVAVVLRVLLGLFFRPAA
jgi:hypothetical protein